MTCRNEVCDGCRFRIVNCDMEDGSKECDVCGQRLCEFCHEDAWARNADGLEACVFCMGSDVRNADLLAFAKRHFGDAWFERFRADYFAAHKPPAGFAYDWQHEEAKQDEE